MAHNKQHFMKLAGKLTRRANKRLGNKSILKAADGAQFLSELAEMVKEEFMKNSDGFKAGPVLQVIFKPANDFLKNKAKKDKKTKAPKKKK